MNNQKIDTVIFDLDGTLLDTLQDLCDSCNKTMQSLGFPQHSLDQVRSFVGNGLGVLIEKAIPQGKANPLFNKALETMRTNYSQNWHNKTAPYQGIAGLLTELKKRGYKCGIVSNKPDEQVKQLNELFFSETISTNCAIGEKESLGIRRKPYPDSVIQVLKNLGSTKSQAVYVGDSDVDLKTASNSGLPCISVTWGFRSRDFLLEHGAQKLIDTPQELLNLI